MNIIYFKTNLQSYPYAAETDLNCCHYRRKTTMVATLFLWQWMTLLNRVGWLYIKICLKNIYIFKQIFQMHVNSLNSISGKHHATLAIIASIISEQSSRGLQRKSTDKIGWGSDNRELRRHTTTPPSTSAGRGKVSRGVKCGVVQTDMPTYELARDSPECHRVPSPWCLDTSR